MIVVFDFDKTLTYKDSLAELFKERTYGFLKVFYYILKLLSKLGFISVKREKLIMIHILFGADEEVFAHACRKQASNIKFTPIMDCLKKCILDGDRVIVLSASAIYLLREVFKGMHVEIIGSEFVAYAGRIRRFRQHPFDREKIELLQKYGIRKVDDAYFDSHHDECLKSITRQWYHVKDGIVVESNQTV